MPPRPDTRKKGNDEERPASPVPEIPGINADALARYLPTALDDYDPAARLTISLLSGGRSNLTCILSQPSGRQWVLRWLLLGHVLPTANDMTREFKILSLLTGSTFPAPRPRALFTDHAVLSVASCLPRRHRGQAAPHAYQCRVNPTDN